MAKKSKLETSDFNLDNELDFNDFSIDDIDNSVNSEVKQKNARKPIIETFKSTIKSAKSRFAEPSFINKVVKGALPKQYGEVLDRLDTSAATLSSLYNDAAKDLKPQLSRLAKKIDSLVPNDDNIIKQLTGKIKNLVGDEVESRLPGKNEQFEQQAIDNSLAAVFQQQQEYQRDADLRKQLDDKLRQGIEQKQFESTFVTLNSIDQNISRLASYNDKITQAYQKKSLELQFRSYFAQTELLETTKRSFELFKAQNESIVKNTALPEFVKINNSERFHELTKTKFFTSFQNSLFGDDAVLTNAFKNLKRQTKDLISGLKFGIEQTIDGLDAVDMIKQQSDMLVEMGEQPISTQEIFGSMLGQQLADKFGEVVSDKIRNRIKEDSAISRFGFKAAEFNNNLGGKIKGLKESNFIRDNEFDTGVKGKLAGMANFVLDLFHTGQPDMDLQRNQGLGGLKATAFFDRRAHLTLVDVIPGYLARIHRELMVLRGADEKQGMISYDFTTHKFVSRDQLAGDIRKSLANSIRGSSADFYLQRAIEDITNNKPLGDKQAKHLKSFFSDLAMQRMDYTPENIKNSDLFKALDSRTAKLVSESLDNKISQASSPEKGQHDLTRSIMSIRRAAPDIREEIELFVKAGYADILEEQGLIKQSANGSYSIDFDMYKKLVRDNTVVTSDVNAKHHISSFSPKRALSAIKRTRLYNWFYKKGFGDSQPHMGPMAQDIHRNMGEQAAPGGTSIDLTTMNGINMAAIQALQQNQEKLSKQGDSILSKIKQDTGDIVSLLSGENIVTGKKGKRSRRTAGSQVAHSRSLRANDSYKNILINLLTTSADAAFVTGENILKFGVGVGGKLGQGVDKTVRTIFNLLGDNKDDLTQMFKKMFTKAGELTVGLMDSAKDVLYNKIPAGVKQFTQLAKEATNKLFDLVDGPVDVYIKGLKTPVLRANLLKMGYYLDQASGKVIRSIDDIKGPVVNQLGEVVLTLDEIADGLFDKDRKPIESRVTRIAKSIIGAGVHGFNQLSNLANNALGGFKDLKIFDKLKGFGFPLIGGFPEKSHQMLVEIRDILRAMAGDSYTPAKTLSAGNFRYSRGSAGGKLFGMGKNLVKRSGMTSNRRDFNDLDNSGKRDGSYEDILVAQKAKEEERKQKIKEASKVEVKTRYKSDENIMDTIFNKTKGLLDMLNKDSSSVLGSVGEAIGGMAEAVDAVKDIGRAKGIFGKGKAIIKAPFKIASTLGKGLLNIGGTAATVLGAGKLLKHAQTARTAMMAGSLLTAGSGGAILSTITALGAALTSPVVIGSAAIAATVYGIYRGVKHFTRNNTTPYQDIRIKQYGLTNSGDDKEYNHFILDLEHYLLTEGIVAYRQNQSYLLEQKLDVKKLLAIFAIDPKDHEQLAKFQYWFTQRFKPFFLTHTTALYLVNNKANLNELDGLTPAEQARYLELIGFDSGPYEELTSPFKGKESLTNTQQLTTDSVKALLAAVVKARAKQSKDNKPALPEHKEQNIIKPLKEESKQAPFKPIPVSTKDSAFSTQAAEDGMMKTDPQLPKSVIQSNTRLNEATGPLSSGENAGQYIKLAPGVKLDGINEVLWKNFKMMVEEYGVATGKTITITSGTRSFEEQQRLYQQNPAKAAKPGTSMHEHGLALDVSSADLDAMDKLGLMRKYGFTRPVGGESWHTEPAGIQKDLATAKNNTLLANQWIEASLFKGGGGIGSIKGSTLGQRDSAYALSLMGVSANKIEQAKQKIDDDITLSNKVKLPQVDNREVVQPVEDRSNVVKFPSRNPSLTTQEITPDLEANGKSLTGVRNDSNLIKTKDDVKDAIKDVSRKAGTDATTLQGFAAVESGLNPNAQSPNTNATGLYQFMPATWREQVDKFGGKYNLPANSDPRDVTASTLMASEYIKTNQKFLSSVKSDVNLTDIYLAHFLGPNGARKFLKALKDTPEMSAAGLLKDAAAKNRNLFYRNNQPLTVAEFYDNIGRLLARKAGEYNINLPPSMTALNGFATREQAAEKGNNADLGYLSSITTTQQRDQNVVQGGNNGPARPSGDMFRQQPVPITARPVEPNRNEMAMTAALDKGFSNVNDTLTKSLDVQTQILEVLKTIAAQSTSQDTKVNTPPQLETPERNTSNRQITSVIDLKRKSS